MRQEEFPHNEAGKDVRKTLRGELAPLAGVEYVRRSVSCHRLFQRVDTKGGIERVRQPEGQNLSACLSP